MKLPINEIICGENIDAVSEWADNCIDSIVTDPPYGLSFMGKDWDKGVPSVKFWKEFLRICKPGAIMLCFGGTRTYHRMTCAIEDAGWEIRDCIMWFCGQGFPKSLDIGKAIDKLRGNERKIIGSQMLGGNAAQSCKEKGGTYASNTNLIGVKPIEVKLTQGQSEWEGYGTGIKPGYEPIVVAMKPLDGTFANNAEKWGVAGLNIDGGRIDYQSEQDKKLGQSARPSLTKDTMFPIDGFDRSGRSNTQGRWPSNVILDEEAAKMLDEQKEGASRFFYQAKASKKERNIGLNCESQITDDGRKKKIDNPYLRGKTLRQNHHPTVKPLALMKYLCTLVKMPNPDQIILDPFMGSGTTGMACVELGINYIGIDISEKYCDIARQRVKGTLLKFIC